MTDCHDCGVKVGSLHVRGCDVEHCPYCGGQVIGCGCVVPDDDRMPWSGEWPGTEVCAEFGWYARLVRGRGWVPCGPEEEGAAPDLNRLYSEAVWDRETKRSVKRME